MFAERSKTCFPRALSLEFEGESFAVVGDQSAVAFHLSVHNFEDGAIGSAEVVVGDDGSVKPRRGDIEDIVAREQPL